MRRPFLEGAPTAAREDSGIRSGSDPGPDGYSRTLDQKQTAILVADALPALRPASPRDQPRVRAYRHQLAARPRRGTGVRLDAIVAGAVDDGRRVQAGGRGAALADGIDPSKRATEGLTRARGVEAARRDIGAAGAHGAGGRLDAKAIAPAEERAGLAALRLRAVAERGGTVWVWRRLLRAEGYARGRDNARAGAAGLPAEGQMAAELVVGLAPAVLRSVLGALAPDDPALVGLSAGGEGQTEHQAAHTTAHSGLRPPGPRGAAHDGGRLPDTLGIRTPLCLSCA